MLSVRETVAASVLRTVRSLALPAVAALAVSIAQPDAASAQMLSFGSNGQVRVVPGNESVGVSFGSGGPSMNTRPVSQNPGYSQPSYNPPSYNPPSYQPPTYNPPTYQLPSNPQSGVLPPYYGRPSNPYIVTPDQISGINPQTGGYDTRNNQINDTYFDQGRHSSQFNGTKRFVRRPVYRNGQVVGYQEGYVWNNSQTGQEHGELKTVTPNDKGGIHTGIVAQSVMPKK